MTLHLQKLSVGSENLKSLQSWQKKVVARRKQHSLSPCHEHITRMSPKRQEELLQGGSIYWVIKGLILCRNRIIGFESRRTEEGHHACAILMEPKLIAVEPTPKRPFQGWRYLKPENAPSDLIHIDQVQSLPIRLQTKLMEQGLW